MRPDLPAEPSKRENRSAGAPNSKLVNAYVRWHVLEPHAALFEHHHVLFEVLCVNVMEQIQQDSF